MICTVKLGKMPIRVSLSRSKYFRLDEGILGYFFYGNLSDYKLPIIGPDVLTRWEDEVSIR